MSLDERFGVIEAAPEVDEEDVSLSDGVSNERLFLEIRKLWRRVTLLIGSIQLVLVVIGYELYLHGDGQFGILLVVTGLISASLFYGSAAYLLGSFDQAAVIWGTFGLDIPKTEPELEDELQGGDGGSDD